jgi:AmmeMemoRadiSam system protein A
MKQDIDVDQANILLKIAREAIGSRLNVRYVATELPIGSWLEELAATFVTLKIDGQLRGCIGTLTPIESLKESIRKNACNAAFHDNRFRPLTEEEFDRIHIDISILTESRELIYTDAENLISKLQPGKDGVTLRYGRSGATFLPQVWEQLPTPELFLGHLCRKAGLPESCWRDNHPEIETYQVQCFTEEKE